MFKRKKRAPEVNVVVNVDATKLTSDQLFELRRRLAKEQDDARKETRG